MISVVIVGAGVIGLSTAAHLLERFPGKLDLTVVSDKFSPNLTSNKAGAIIVPANDQGTELSYKNIDAGNLGARNAVLDERMCKWSRDTLEHFHTLYKSKENAQMNICLEQGYVIFEIPAPDPWYKDHVFGFRHVSLDSAEAGLLHLPSSVVDVWTFGTYVVETIPYLQWLEDKVKSGGGQRQQKKISSLKELKSYDVIINCTGLGSLEMVGDTKMHPVRGQAVLLDAPWITHWFIFYGRDSYNYLLPRAKNVVVGATSEPHNSNETPDSETAETIVKQCGNFIPSLSEAKVVGGWAGLRPLRDPIRLESCEGPGKNLLVHCYGHGGQGFILSWGCAQEIGDILQNAIISV
jgi:glycine/D-amino acid oxidase-like deaminating enzyme